MSYDVHLVRKDGSKESLTGSELSRKFVGTEGIVNTDMFDDSVIDFEIYSGSDYIKFFYREQKKGSYLTFCPYNLQTSAFNKFIENICKTAKKLDLLISDKQISSENLISPDDYNKNNECSERFILLKQRIGNAIEQIRIQYYLDLIAESYNFILYFIESTNPATNKRVYLVPGKEKVCAGKVNKGSSLYKEIKKDVPELTNSKKYKILKIIKNYDQAPNRNGELLPRDAVYIEVPYFNTNFPFEWELVDY